MPNRPNPPAQYSWLNWPASFVGNENEVEPHFFHGGWGYATTGILEGAKITGKSFGVSGGSVDDTFGLAQEKGIVYSKLAGTVSDCTDRYMMLTLMPKDPNVPFAFKLGVDLTFKVNIEMGAYKWGEYNNLETPGQPSMPAPNDLGDNSYGLIAGGMAVVVVVSSLV